MAFLDILGKYDWNTIGEEINSKTSLEVEIALNHAGKGTLDDFMALLSPVASGYLEDMARLSQELTLKRFGRNIQLYIPLYLSNECTNGCVYCGFNHKNKVDRVTLSRQQIMEEAQKIKQLGFEHILLVTGEHPRKAGTLYLKSVIQQLRELFAQISVEVQPLEQSEYESLIQEGLNSVYIYQETYNQTNYPVYHPSGKKSDFRYRLDTPDRLGKAEIHKIGLGVLLGLEDWRTDSFFTALHMRYLQKQYWKTRYSVSFPRLRPFEGSYKPSYEISDREFVQLITAYRIFDENVELALSTRESASFRDNVLSLGITSMSAGSKTEPGGYSENHDYLEQFKVSDSRSPSEVKAAVESRGYEAVWKNWDESLQFNK